MRDKVWDNNELNFEQTEIPTLYIYLSKILPLFVLPIGFVLELLFIALLFALKGWRRTAATFLVSAMLVLWTASMPFVAGEVMGKLEQDYPAVMMSEVPVGDCIVVLGGTVEPVLPPRVDVDMLESVDRVRKAAQLFHAGRGKMIIATGGNQPWSSFTEPEAESMKVLLLEWGVPAVAIVVEGSSRNTRENARNAIVAMEEVTCNRPLLVTSAAHMKRSVAAFEKLGVTVFPVSADVRVINNPKLTLLDFLPDAGALNMTTDAIREWVGQRVYEMQEWN
jgi:uncharacterized SAM-binding protein YcdF (DUF218 family)